MCFHSWSRYTPPRGGWLGIDPADGVMIGDNPLTDGAGAASVGLAFWQVVPGKLDLPPFADQQLEHA